MQTDGSAVVWEPLESLMGLMSFSYATLWLSARFATCQNINRCPGDASGGPLGVLGGPCGSLRDPGVSLGSLGSHCTVLGRLWGSIGGPWDPWDRGGGLGVPWGIFGCPWEAFGHTCDVIGAAWPCWKALFFVCCVFMLWSSLGVVGEGG